MESPDMVSSWSPVFTRKSLEDVLIGLKWKSRRLFFKTSSRHLAEDVFNTSWRSFKTSLGCLENVSRITFWRRLEKRSSATSISDQSKMSLRQKLIHLYDAFTTVLCRLGSSCFYMNDQINFSIWPKKDAKYIQRIELMQITKLSLYGINTLSKWSFFK